jgi:hypothetical protein
LGSATDRASGWLQWCQSSDRGACRRSPGKIWRPGIDRTTVEESAEARSGKRAVYLYIRGSPSGRGQNRTKVGLKRCKITKKTPTLSRQNRTKVGLKQRSCANAAPPRTWQNRTKVGLKLDGASCGLGGCGAKSNQGGIETECRSGQTWSCELAKSNQGGIETRWRWRRWRVELQAKSNQGGIETPKTPHVCLGYIPAKSNQGGIETGERALSLAWQCAGKIEPRWD